MTSISCASEKDSTPPVNSTKNKTTRRYSYESFTVSSTTSSSDQHQTIDRANDLNREHAQKLIYSAIGKTVIPKGCKGYYTRFRCPYEWTSAFSTAGEFTVKLANVRLDKGQVIYRLAVLCSWYMDSEGRVSRGVEHRLHAFVSFVEKKDEDFHQLAKRFTLLYLGHNLRKYLPKLARANISNTVLARRGLDILDFVMYLLTIDAIGHNRLVQLHSSQIASNHPLVRAFLNLPLVQECQDAVFSSATSCNARMERRKYSSFPPEWMMESPTSYKSPGTGSSMSHSSSMSMKAFKIETQDQHDRRLHHHVICTTFVSPKHWKKTETRCHEPGAFTLELSSISIVEKNESVAWYNIDILYYDAQSTKTMNVRRRFSEFHALAGKMQLILRPHQVLSELPGRTLFSYRSMDESFLEQRSAGLQQFLEFLLGLKIVGFVGQDIEVSADPTVRQFLNLPKLEWTLVPKSSRLSLCTTMAS